MVALATAACQPGPWRKNESPRSFRVCEKQRSQASSICASPISRACSITFLIPSPSSTRTRFEEGFGMDGSSIRGWAAIHESDMLLIPDPATAFMDPFAEIPTLVMVCDVIDPITKQRYERDPRWIAQKAETVSEEQRRGRYRLLRRRSRVLHLRQRALRPEPALRLLLHRRRGGPLELRPRRRTTWAIGRATRKATSRFRPPITTRTCAARWCRP